MSGKHLKNMEKLKICSRCNNEFTGHFNTKECGVCKTKSFCTSCGKEQTKKYKFPTLCIQCEIDLSLQKYTEENKHYWVECVLCGLRREDLSSHIIKHHKLTTKEYGFEVKSQFLCDKIKGSNNPGYQHGGRLSPWSYKSTKHNITTIEQTKEKLKNCRRQLVEDGKNPFTRNYYKTDEDYLNHQRKDLSFFTTKYGDEEGTKRHKEKTQKWMKSFTKNNFSKISQELFDSIMTTYDGNVYYATYERTDKEKYINKEYRIFCGNRGFLLDFVDVDTKRAIEFDGDYWHSSCIANKSKEEERQLLIEQQGFTIMRVKECDYNNNKQEIVDKCIQFLTQ